ncbi:MAG: DUF445 domain-containing protein [Microscillaceae bacterium]|nr:DUF445 domain-containing protein [Microscillaceae bacterium]MDW8459623.1 DUF445 domain-containing protein [Cytophagales bacterium]
MEPSLAENERKRLMLKKIQFLATGLLVLMASLFLLSKYLETSYPWLGFLRAFTEAGMVGALADWFAVVALFRHPLGLPIPHTNLIVQKQEALGKNLGNFVVQNFLDEASIRREVQKIHIAQEVAKWLKTPDNALLLVKELEKFIPNIINGIDAQEMNTFLKNKALHFVYNIDLASLVADILNYFTQKNEHQRLLDYVLKSLNEFLAKDENREWLRQKFNDKGLPSLLGIGTAINETFADGTLEAVQEYSYEVLTTPNHVLRQRYNQLTQRLFADLKNSPEYKQKADKIKDEIIQGTAFQRYTSNIWDELKTTILKDYLSENSKIREYLLKGLMAMAEKLESDTEMRASIDRTLHEEIIQFVQKNKTWISTHIGTTVKNWDKADIADKLELEVGKDLQYIRINGTIVGGLVGLILYLLFDVLFKLH